MSEGLDFDSVTVEVGTSPSSGVLVYTEKRKEFRA